MTRKQKYLAFLESAAKASPKNSELLGKIAAGFRACFEGEEDGDDPEPNYKISLWPGIGYTLTSFYVNAEDEEQAFERLAAKLIDGKENAYFLDTEEYRKQFADELAKDPGYIDERYTYVDGTMEGAKYAIYIFTENAIIEKI